MTAARVIALALAGGVAAAAALSRDGGATHVLPAPADPYAETTLDGLPRGTVVDASGPVLRVANSRTPDPRPGRTCEDGQRPVNPYPLKVDRSPGVVLRGARVAGEVPLGSDWEQTYCNSAAILLRDSPDTRIDGVRITRAWDGIRVSRGSAGFAIAGAWLDDVRDDCIENDFLLPGRVTDSLLDGCFVGISTRPPEGEARRSDGRPLVLDAVLMRSETFLYKGRRLEGPPFKADAAGPRIEIRDSIVALGNPRSVSADRMRLAWSLIGDCSGNLLLWLSDEPWPDAYGRPPDCFRMVAGAQARAMWGVARQNWIDCHPDAPRLPGDTPARASRCRRGPVVEGATRG